MAQGAAPAMYLFFTNHYPYVDIKSWGRIWVAKRPKTRWIALEDSHITRGTQLNKVMARTKSWRWNDADNYRYSRRCGITKPPTWWNSQFLCLEVGIQRASAWHIIIFRATGFRHLGLHWCKLHGEPGRLLGLERAVSNPGGLRCSSLPSSSRFGSFPRRYRGGGVHLQHESWALSCRLFIPY